MSQPTHVRLRIPAMPSARRVLAAVAAALSLGAAGMPSQAATTALADQPLFSDANVPGNLALALSVEFPTAISRAHTGTTYSATSTYLGYFDPNKCYLYQWDAVEANRYFYPAGAAPTNRSCGTQYTTQQRDQSNANSGTGSYGKFSGNYLNWATMQTIDPFRWALTGGYRVVDTTTTTIIEKAWASSQGSEGSNFARKSLDAATATAATPFPVALTTRVWALGNQIRMTSTGNLNNTGVAYSGPGAATDPAGLYEFSVRVKVCDSNTASAGPLESNCVAYGSNYKPEGLMQAYSNRIRFAAFGYLNDGNLLRDGGVLRARMKYIGATKPVPGQPNASNAAAKEWDETTGIFIANPDPADATATFNSYNVSVSNSGVMNYLNKFGSTAHTYKTYDPVSELYYAAVRYYKNLGNVTAWTPDPSSSNRTAWVDGFPVIPAWDDPILYSCQKNFILGIGDTNTHADKNVSGDGTPTGNEPTKPSEVVADVSTQSVTATTYVGNFQGINNLGTTNPWTGGNNNNSALMAGLAYHTHTVDIRPDNASAPNTLGKQTITTYWLDVLESGFGTNNQFYLAAKYGGFTVPTSYDYANTPNSFWLNNANKPLWNTTTDLVGSQPRPDNYYTADRPDTMVAGLTKAFASIASALKAYTGAFAVSSPQLSTSGNATYSTQYDAGSWTGEVTASTLSFDASNNAVLTQNWLFSTVLAAQAGGTGWDAGRRIVTWNPTTAAGIPFRATSLSTSQKSALDTPYRAGDDSSTYINYIRGDQSQETAATEPYRVRSLLVGDIVGSKATAVGAPNAGYSDATNPGYAAYRTLRSARTPMVYVGSNDGMVHGINGNLTGTGAGQEVFALIPNAVIMGPSGTPAVDGLASRGNPTFTHKYLVNATPGAYDIDFGKTSGGSGTPDWRTVLIGGLGKGGKSYYAIDVSDPSALATESGASSKVLWEFTDTDMGFTFGDPVVAKTARWGWVVIFTSGYNNPDGKGYFFVVNPRDGSLLAKVSTNVGSTTTPAGLAYANGWVLDKSSYTSDAVYAGDLLGNIWRLDLTGTSGSLPTPLKLAFLTDGTNPQPITTYPQLSAQPSNNARWVLVGTGRLLDNSDVASTQVQSFYGIVDGSNGGFGTTLPTGLSYPITRSQLARVTDVTAGATYNPATQDGWYFDLGTGTNGIGWRVNLPATAYNGSVSFAANLPSGDVCNPTGSGRGYILNFATGQSLTVVNQALVGFTAFASSVTDVYTATTGNGQAVSLFGRSDGGIGAPSQKPAGGGTLKRLNWRELPVVN